MQDNHHIRYVSIYEGRRVPVCYPPGDLSGISIESIAHSLALTNRYNGHTRVPYSVAEHCVRMTWDDMPGDPLTNLLHDAAESLIGDIVGPLKSSIFWWPDLECNLESHPLQLDQLENGILRKLSIALVGKRLDFDSPETHMADRIMAVTELRDLLPSSIWQEIKQDYEGIDPLCRRIEPWDWQTAKRKYIRRFRELTGG